MEKLSKAILQLEQSASLCAKHIETSSSNSTNAVQNSKQRSATLNREKQACSELRQFINSWDVETLPKTQLHRVISILLRLLNHQEQTIRFSVGQILDAVFRRFQLKFQPQRAIAFLLAELERSRDLPARTISGALQRLSFSIKYLRINRAGVYGNHFMNAICICLERTNEESIQQAISEYFPPIFNLLGDSVATAYAEKAEELFNCAFQNIDVQGVHASNAVSSVIKGLVQHIPALLHKAFYKLSDMIFKSDKNANKTRLVNSMRCFRLLFNIFANKLDDSTTLIIQKVIFTVHSLLNSKHNELVIAAFELLIEFTKCTSICLKALDFNPLTLPIDSAIATTISEEERNIKNEHIVEENDVYVTPRLGEFNDFGGSLLSLNTRATTSTWGSMTDLFVPSTSMDGQNFLLPEISPSGTTFSAHSATEDTFSCKSDEDFRVQKSGSVASLELCSLSVDEERMTEGGGSTEEDKFSLVSSSNGHKKSSSLFDPLINCSLDMEFCCPDEEFDHTKMTTKFERRRSGSVTPTDMLLARKNEFSTPDESARLIAYRSIENDPSFWNYSTTYVLLQFLLTEPSVQNTQSWQPISDREVRVSQKILALTYLSSLVQRLPNLLDLKYNCINGNGSCKPLPELSQYVLHEDDHLAVSAFNFSLIILKISILLPNKRISASDKTFRLLKKVVSSGGKQSSTRLKSIFQLLSHSSELFLFDEQLLTASLNMALTSSQLNYFLLKANRVEFLSKINWKHITNGKISEKYQEHCFSMFFDSLCDADSRVRRAALNALPKLILNASFFNDELADMVLPSSANFCGFEQSIYLPFPKILGLPANFYLFANESIVKEKINPILEADLLYLLRSIYSNMMSNFFAHASSFLETFVCLLSNFPPQLFPNAWHPGILWDLTELFLEHTFASLEELSTVLRGTIALYTTIFETNFIQAPIENTDECLKNKPFFNRLMLLFMRVTNLYYSIVAEEKQVSIENKRRLEGSLTSAASSGASGIMNATAAFFIGGSKRNIFAKKPIEENELIGDSVDQNTFSNSSPTHTKASNLCKQLFINGINVQKNSETCFTRSFALKSLEAKMRNAYRSFLNNLSPESHHRFLDPLEALLEGFTILLETMTVQELLNVLDELLLYLRAIVDINLTLSVRLIHSLLKCILGGNLVSSKLKRLIKEETPTKHQKLANEAGWFWLKNVENELKEAMDSQIVEILSKFEPFITHMMRLYTGTNQIETRRAILHCLCTLCMNKINYSLLDQNNKFYGRVLDQLVQLSAEEDAPLLADIFTFLCVLRTFGFMDQAQILQQLEKVFVKFDLSNSPFALEALRIVVFDILSRFKRRSFSSQLFVNNTDEQNNNDDDDNNDEETKKNKSLIDHITSIRQLLSRETAAFSLLENSPGHTIEIWALVLNATHVLCCQRGVENHKLCNEAASDFFNHYAKFCVSAFGPGKSRRFSTDNTANNFPFLSGAFSANKPFVSIGQILFGISKALEFCFDYEFQNGNQFLVLFDRVFIEIVEKFQQQKQCEEEAKDNCFTKNSNEQESMKEDVAEKEKNRSTSSITKIIYRSFPLLLTILRRIQWRNNNNNLMVLSLSPSKLSDSNSPTKNQDQSLTDYKNKEDEEENQKQQQFSQEEISEKLQFLLIKFLDLVFGPEFEEHIKFVWNSDDQHKAEDWESVITYFSSEIVQTIRKENVFPEFWDSLAKTIFERFYCSEEFLREMAMLCPNAFISWITFLHELGHPEKIRILEFLNSNRIPIFIKHRLPFFVEKKLSSSKLVKPSIELEILKPQINLDLLAIDETPSPLTSRQTYIQSNQETQPYSKEHPLEGEKEEQLSPLQYALTLLESMSKCGEDFAAIVPILFVDQFSVAELEQFFNAIPTGSYLNFLQCLFSQLRTRAQIILHECVGKKTEDKLARLFPLQKIIDGLVAYETSHYIHHNVVAQTSEDIEGNGELGTDLMTFANPDGEFPLKKHSTGSHRSHNEDGRREYTFFIFAQLHEIIGTETEYQLKFPENMRIFMTQASIDRFFAVTFMAYLIDVSDNTPRFNNEESDGVELFDEPFQKRYFEAATFYFSLPIIRKRYESDETTSLRIILPFLSLLWEFIEKDIPRWRQLKIDRQHWQVSATIDENLGDLVEGSAETLKADLVNAFNIVQHVVYTISNRLLPSEQQTYVEKTFQTLFISVPFLQKMAVAPELALRYDSPLTISVRQSDSKQQHHHRSRQNHNHYSSTVITVSMVNIHLLNELPILADFSWRVFWLGWTNRTQFEEFWVSFFGVLSSLPANRQDFLARIEEEGPEELQAQVQASVYAIGALTNLLTSTALHPRPGCFVHSWYAICPRKRRDNFPFLVSTQFRRSKAFIKQLLHSFNGRDEINSSTEILHIENLEAIVSGDDPTVVYGLGQISLYQLWSAIDLLDGSNSSFPNSPIKSRLSSISTTNKEEFFENADSNFIGIDTSSSIRALFDTFMNWLSLENIQYLSVDLLCATLKSLAILSDFFYSVLFWRELFAVLRALHNSKTTPLDGHPVARAFANFLLLKCASVLDWSVEFNSEETSIVRFVEQILKTGIGFGQQPNKKLQSTSLSQVQPSLLIPECTLRGTLYLFQSLNLNAISVGWSWLATWLLDELERNRRLPDVVEKCTMESSSYESLLWSVAFELFGEVLPYSDMPGGNPLREQFIGLTCKMFVDPRLPTWLKRLLAAGMEQLVVRSMSYVAPFKQASLECFDTYQLRPLHLPYALGMYFCCAYRELDNGNEAAYLFNKGFNDEFQKLLNIFTFYAAQPQIARVYSELFSDLISVIWAKEQIIQNIWTMLVPVSQHHKRKQQQQQQQPTSVSKNTKFSSLFSGTPILAPLLSGFDWDRKSSTGNNNKIVKEGDSIDFTHPLQQIESSTCGTGIGDESLLGEHKKPYPLPPLTLTQFDRSLLQLLSSIVNKMCTQQRGEQRAASIDLLINNCLWPRIFALFEDHEKHRSLARCIALVFVCSLAKEPRDRELVNIEFSCPSTNSFMCHSIPRWTLKRLASSLAEEVRCIRQSKVASSSFSPSKSTTAPALNEADSELLSENQISRILLNYC